VSRAARRNAAKAAIGAPCVEALSPPETGFRESPTRGAARATASVHLESRPHSSDGCVALRPSLRVQRGAVGAAERQPVFVGEDFI